MAQQMRAARVIFRAIRANMAVDLMGPRMDQYARIWASAAVKSLEGEGLLAPQPWLHVLSEREFEVLDGMRRGLSNGRIARELYLSEDTIKTHARRLFRKLGVRDRSAAVAEGYEREWFVPAGGGRRA